MSQLFFYPEPPLPNNTTFFLVGITFTYTGPPICSALFSYLILLPAVLCATAAVITAATDLIGFFKLLWRFTRLNW